MDVVRFAFIIQGTMAARVSNIDVEFGVENEASAKRLLSLLRRRRPSPGALNALVEGLVFDGREEPSYHFDTDYADQTPQYGTVLSIFRILLDNTDDERDVEAALRNIRARGDRVRHGWSLQREIGEKYGDREWFDPNVEFRRTLERKMAREDALARSNAGLQSDTAIREALYATDGDHAAAARLLLG